MERALDALDEGTATRARTALAGLRRMDGGTDLGMEVVRAYLWRVLPVEAGGRDRHEAAWALGDLFEAAGLVEQAALARSATTHEIFAVWRWTESFSAVAPRFWRPALERLGPTPAAPARVGLSVASARAMLEVVGDAGVELGADGGLSAATVTRLDDRFRWTEEFPWMHHGGESGLPPVRFLREHLTAQRLMVHDHGRLALTAAGRAAVDDLAALWRALVSPAPRWSHEFDRDVLGLMAAALTGSGVFEPDRLAEELAAPLASKWRSAGQGAIVEGASLVLHAWYQLGVPLGWWDTGRGPADRHPNAFGRAAAGAVFRSMGHPVQRPLVR